MTPAMVTALLIVIGASLGLAAVKAPMGSGFRVLLGITGLLVLLAGASSLLPGNTPVVPDSMKRAAEPATPEPAPDNSVSDGVYLVGTDIPAGRYKGSVTGNAPYWEISSDANGSDIVENDGPDGQFYVEVIAGQFLTLRDVSIIEFAAEPATPEPVPDNSVSDGVYLVGTDIPAGRYKGSVTGNAPYWEISSDANGSDIVENDGPDGQFYVEVIAGQFLTLRDVSIGVAP